jgi:hypothetical protein
VIFYQSSESLLAPLSPAGGKIENRVTGLATIVAVGVTSEAVGKYLDTQAKPLI